MGRDENGIYLAKQLLKCGLQGLQVRRIGFSCGKGGQWGGCGSVGFGSSGTQSHLSPITFPNPIP